MQQQQHVQNSIDMSDSYQVLHKYWSRWREYIQGVNRQRLMSMRVLQYQNRLQQRKLQECFHVWQEFIFTKRIQRINELKQSIVREQQQQQQQQQQKRQQQCQQQQNCINPHHYENNNHNNSNDKQQQMFKMGLAINYHQKKIKTKSLRSLILYNICTRKFTKKLTHFYIHFLLNKYFTIINQYKINSKNKRLRKALTTANDNSLKHNLQQQSFADHSYVDLIKTTLNPTSISKQYFTINNNNQPFNKNINKQINLTAQKQQQSNVHSNTVFNFQRNPPMMGQSRKSQFSPVSANMNYQSKRKFRPIMQLPSIPDIQTASYKKQPQLYKQQLERYNNLNRFYQSRAQSQTAPYEINQRINLAEQRTNLAESKVTEIEQEHNGMQQKHISIKEKILNLIMKQKLISLAMMSGEQFSQGMEYENYREKIKACLKRIKEVKV